MGTLNFLTDTDAWEILPGVGAIVDRQIAAEEAVERREREALKEGLIVVGGKAMEPDETLDHAIAAAQERRRGAGE